LLIFGPARNAVIGSKPKACMPADAASKMSEKDWKEMFPPLLVA
jgi:hypothetical protein